MRRRLVLFIAALLFAEFATAQTTEVVAPSDSVHYLSPEEYAMMLDQDDRFLLRADLLGVGLEWGFSNSYSIAGGIGIEAWLYGRIELRRYLETERIARASLSGLYISLGAEATNRSNAWMGPYSQFYFAKLGLQRRFLGNGLADLGIRVGFFNENLIDYDYTSDILEFETINEQYFLIETSTSIGLAFGSGGKKKLDYDRLCPVLKCYDTERFLVKLNVANSFRLAVGQAFDVYLQPSVAIEQKINDSPFSLQAKLKLRQGFSSTNNSEFYSWRYQNGFTIDLEGRYYYNLKNRIAKGKTGNSLSANYVSLVYSRRDQWIYNDGNGNPSDYHENGIFVQTGVQRTFGERLYFDVYIGFGVTEWTTTRKSFEAPGGVECGWRF